MMGLAHVKHLIALMALITVVITVVLVGVINATQTAVDSQNAYKSDKTVMNQMTVLTNELRAKKNLLPLAEDANLEESAKAKLDHMDENNYWGHYAPDGGKFSDFIWKEKPSADVVGENLAKCFATPKDAFEGFVNSPTHYEILVGDFTNIGIANKTINDNCESIVLHVSK